VSEATVGITTTSVGEGWVVVSVSVGCAIGVVVEGGGGGGRDGVDVGVEGGVVEGVVTPGGVGRAKNAFDISKLFGISDGDGPKVNGTSLHNLQRKTIETPNSPVSDGVLASGVSVALGP
jgi:hypothetical protein